MTEKYRKSTHPSEIFPTISPEQPVAMEPPEDKTVERNLDSMRGKRSEDYDQKSSSAWNPPTSAERAKLATILNAS
ncbi:hypothetical protein [Mesorhizobium australicum]|uniref:hypothetical protein n=1 Tax=Mesorhizobium australicum TaxID=536018 RepID=UPI003335FC73